MENMLQFQDRIFVLELETSGEDGQPDPGFRFDVTNRLLQVGNIDFTIDLPCERFEGAEGIRLNLGNRTCFGFDLVPTCLTVSSTLSDRHGLPDERICSVHLGEDLVSLSATYIIKLSVNGFEKSP